MLFLACAILKKSRALVSLSLARPSNWDAPASGLVADTDVTGQEAIMHHGALAVAARCTAFENL